MSFDKELTKPESFFQELDKMSDQELLEFLQAWHERGESPEEIKSFVEYIQAIQKPVDLGLRCFDCSGTGGDKANTFNISTAAAFLAAKAGVTVTKNGGRSTTSKAGSVDVLEALGVDLDMDFDAKVEELKKTNLAFFSSNVSRKLLARVKQVCRENKVTSFLSLVGPLTGPVKLSGQILGTGHKEWMNIIAETIELMLRDKCNHLAENYRVMIVHSSGLDSAGEDFRLDEISAVSPTEIIEIEASPNGVQRRAYTFSPEDIGLPLGKIEDLVGGDAKANAAIIKDILDNKNKDNAFETKKRAVALNAAAIVYLAAKAKSLEEAYKLVLTKY